MRRFAPLLAVLLVATSVRVASHAAVRDGPIPHFHHWSESDMHFFHGWARKIAAGDLLGAHAGPPVHTWHENLAREAHRSSGSPEPYGAAVHQRIWERWLGAKRFYQDPLYPYLVAGVYALGGDDPGPVFVIQALLGVAHAALVYALAARLFGPTPALLAGLLAGLFGPALFYEHLLLRCTLLDFLGLGGLVLGAAALDRPERRAPFGAAGFVWGLAVLAKSSNLLVPPVFVGLTLHRLRRAPARGLARTLYFGLGFCLALGPLLARNIAVGAPPFALAASGVVNFVGHNAVDGAPVGGAPMSTRTGEILRETDGRLGPAVRETLATHPRLSSWLGLLGRKLAAFWHEYEAPDNASYDYYRLEVGRLSWLLVPFWWIGPLAGIGLLLGSRRSHAQTLVIAYILAGVATTLLFFHVSRFRVPIAGALIPFAAFACVELVRRARARAWGRLVPALAGLALLAVPMFRPLPAGQPRMRIADYGVPNEIAGHLAARLGERGEGEAALRTLERQIALEPADLRALEPRPEPSRVSALSAALAGSFRDLHRQAAELNQLLGRSAAAREHARHADVLGYVAAKVERTPRER